MAADAGGDVDRLKVGAPSQQGLEEAGWLVDLEPHLLDPVAEYANAEGVSPSTRASAETRIVRSPSLMAGRLASHLRSPGAHPAESVPHLLSIVPKRLPALDQ